MPTWPSVTRAIRSLKPSRCVGRRSAQAEVGVDHLDILLAPAEVEGAPAQVILQAQALLVGQHLVRGGLADVDHRAPCEVAVVDQFRSHGSPPRGGLRRLRRSRAAAPRGCVARRVRAGRACRHLAVLGQGDQLRHRLERRACSALHRAAAGRGSSPRAAASAARGPDGRRGRGRPPGRARAARSPTPAGTAGRRAGARDQ